MSLTSFLEWKNLQEAALPQEKIVNTQNIPSNFKYDNIESALQEANRLEPRFRSILEEALRKGGYNNGYVKTDIKMPESIQRKILSKKKTNPQFNVTSLTDILRGQIVTDNDPKLTEGVAKYIYNKQKVLSYEYKASPKDQDRTGYHGTYHIDINVDDMPCEIQILTKSQKSIKAVSDKAYQVARVGQDVPPEMLKLLAGKWKGAGQAYEPTGKKERPKFRYDPAQD